MITGFWLYTVMPLLKSIFLVFIYYLIINVTSFKFNRRFDGVKMRKTSNSPKDNTYEDILGPFRLNLCKYLPHSLILAFFCNNVGMSSAKAVLENGVNPASVSSTLLSNQAWRRAEFNSPSDDFWYPPFLIGDWSANFKFEEAAFIDENVVNMPLEKVLKQGEVPGIEKYSVLITPFIGEDVNDVPLRFVQVDSHPREDHPYNMRQMIEKFSGGDGHVEDARYSFQKATDLFHIPANHWNIKFHTNTDTKGTSKSYHAALETKNRDITTFAGSVETVEFIRQTLISGDERPKKTDYTLNWQFSVPASLRDEFVTVDDLRKADTVVGRLNIFVYVQPSNDLYLKLKGQPVGVYKYVVNMKRIETEADRGADETVFPFVWRAAGPVELDYFK